MNYLKQFENHLNQLKSENRYRSFVELERHVGRHPYATWNSPTGPKDVIRCSNDYPGMGQHPAVIDAMQSSIVIAEAGWWHPQHFWTSTAIVKQRRIKLHQKSRAPFSLWLRRNEASISAIAGLLNDVVIFSDEMNAPRSFRGSAMHVAKVIFRHNDCLHLKRH